MPAVPKQKPKQSEAKTKQKARKAQGARTDPGGKPLLRRVDRRVDLDAALRRRRRELALEALARVGHERAAAGEHDARPEILAHLLVGRRGVDRPLDERCCRLRECYVCVCVCVACVVWCCCGGFGWGVAAGVWMWWLWRGEGRRGLGRRVATKAGRQAGTGHRQRRRRRNEWLRAPGQLSGWRPEASSGSDSTPGNAARRAFFLRCCVG